MLFSGLTLPNKKADTVWAVADLIDRAIGHLVSKTTCCLCSVSFLLTVSAVYLV